MTSRRDVLRATAAVPLGLLAPRPGTAETAPAVAPPPYTISINIEIMFNVGRGNPPMPRADRMRAVAAKGFKAYSFWNASADERKAMLKAQQETGLKCVSLVGTGTGPASPNRARKTPCSRKSRSASTSRRSSARSRI